MKNLFLSRIVKCIMLTSVTMLLAGCGSYSVEATPCIIVATNAYFAPYEYYDDNNSVTGIDVDIINEIGRRLNKDIVIIDMDFENLLTAVSSGKVDCTISAMTVTPERKAQVLFTNSYAHSVQRIVVKIDSAYKSIDDLSDAIIGVQGGTTGATYAKDDFSSVVEYSKVNELEDALRNNKIDAIIVDAGPANELVSSNTDFEVLDTPYADEEYAIGVSKSKDILYNEINKTLIEMINDGTVESIFAKYSVEF